MLKYGYNEPSLPKTNLLTVNAPSLGLGDKQTSIPSTSKSTLPQKFFERTLSNDLNDLENFLLQQYKRVESGELLKEPKSDSTLWKESHSESTVYWNKYNAFQFYHPGIYALAAAVKEMTQEACEYYGLDFKKEQFYMQSWFNVNYSSKGKLDWHEHGGDGAPCFHGYYAVKAEPSTTHYQIFGEYKENINKDNRAVLSETGHPHAMADWSWEGPRITVAYDVFPLRFMTKEWEQHWIPLV
jgi:hypothetical protein